LRWPGGSSWKRSGRQVPVRLNAGNGEIIAVGEAYESKSAAMRGIDSVRRNAADPAVDDQS